MRMPAVFTALALKILPDDPVVALSNLCLVAYVLFPKDLPECLKNTCERA